MRERDNLTLERGKLEECRGAAQCTCGCASQRFREKCVLEIEIMSSSSRC